MQAARFSVERGERRHASWSVAAPVLDDAEEPVSRDMNQPIDDGREPARAAMNSLRRIFRSLRAFRVASQRHQRVSAAQLFVLRQIRGQPGLSVSELASRTLATQSAVSEVVSRLVRAGLVTRVAAPTDHRRAQLSVTSAGEEVLTTSPETVQERLVRGFRSLPPRQQQALAEGLNAWLAAAGLADVPPSMFLEPVAGEGPGGRESATRSPSPVSQRVC
jgi:MarR family transcriptional regulator, organic hydroperoxide resistance regulator